MNPKQKMFLPSNFRFEIGSLPCQGVSKIDAFTFKQAVVSTPSATHASIRSRPGQRSSRT